MIEESYQTMYVTKDLKSTTPNGPVHAAENNVSDPKTLCGLGGNGYPLWYRGPYTGNLDLFTCKKCRKIILERG